MPVAMRVSLTATGAAIALLAGCAGDAPTRRDDSSLSASGQGGGARGFRPGTRPVGGDEPEDGLVVENELGSLNQQDVDRALERHVSTLVRCYERAGDAQKFAEGEVVLRFLVAGTGAVSYVLVVKNSLGNYAVERCLVVEARRIVFPSPGGRKETDFEYSLRFRSSGEIGVVAWDGDVFNKDLIALSPPLASCGPVGGTVRVVAYIQPGGAVASLGLSSPDPIDSQAAICVVEQMRSWKLPADTTHVVRTDFPLVISAAAAPSPTRPSQLVKRSSRRSSRR